MELGGEAPSQCLSLPLPLHMLVPFQHSIEPLLSNSCVQSDGSLSMHDTGCKHGT